jgi:hypothetical protein
MSGHHRSGARTGQEPSIGRQRIKRTEETKALDEFTHKEIYRDHALRLLGEKGGIGKILLLAPDSKE